MTTIFTNARLVLPDASSTAPSCWTAPNIREVQPGRSHAPGAIDLDGDTLMPGVVDLHTDNLERQVQPRTNARWPSRSAMVAHDAQCAAAGVTTVLDALCLGDLGFEKDRIRTFHDGVADLDALADTGLLKSDHYLHLRCELPAADMLDLLRPGGRPSPRPHDQPDGPLPRRRPIRQPRPLPRHARRRAHTADRIERRIARAAGPARAPARPEPPRACSTASHGHAGVLASHDDRTEEEVEENHRTASASASSPSPCSPRQAARARGMEVIAGAPNIVRGGSHSGNVSAADLVRAGAVDALASDYVPASLIEAAFACARSRHHPARRRRPGHRQPRPHGRPHRPRPHRGRPARRPGARARARRHAGRAPGLARRRAGDLSRLPGPRRRLLRARRRRPALARRLHLARPRPGDRRALPQPGLPDIDDSPQTRAATASTPP